MLAFSSRVLVTALLSSVLYFSATALPASNTEKDETVAVVEVVNGTLDGIQLEQNITLPVQSSNSSQSKNDTVPSKNEPKEFKPSVLYQVVQASSPRLKNNGRILQNRRLRVRNYPGMIRKFDKEVSEGVQQNYSPGILKLFSGSSGNDKENVSAPAHQTYGAQQLEHSQQERPKLYYGDVSKHSQPSGQLMLEYGADMHVGHHAGNVLEQEHASYYFPKNLMRKHPKHSVVATQGHEKHVSHPSQSHEAHHVHHEHHDHGHHDQHHEHGHSDHGHHEQGHHDHGHHGHGHLVHSSGHEFEDYRGHGHSYQNSIVPVIGKALQLLIPSALLITGASALFPTRIHVPTNDLPKTEVTRHKRSAYDDMPLEHDVVPSMYLRREHRADEDDGVLLYDDEDYLDPSATTTYGERTEAHKAEDKKEEMPMPEQIPEFKPIPSDIPVIILNQLKPINVSEGPFLGNFEDSIPSDQQESNKSESQLSLESSSPLESSSGPTTATTTTTQSAKKLTPQETMSRLLMATLSTTFPTQPTVNKTELPAPAEQLPKPERRIGEDPNNKPLFRPASTDRPYPPVLSSGVRMIPVFQRPTPSNHGRHDEPIELTARILHNQGPRIIELGGNDTDASSLHPVTPKPNTIQNGTSNEINEGHDIDLAPDSPVVGLITNYAARENDSPQCQKRALCELAVRGAKDGATKFERFLWNLASLVPPSLSVYYDLEDTFGAVVRRKCSQFICANPNLDLQETNL